MGEDYKGMSRKAANIISAQIILKPDCVLGLATGSTPIGTYDQLVNWYEKGDLDFSKVVTINLDEYKGLSGDNDQSYRYFMNKHLFDRINIYKENTYVPNGLEADSKKACQEYNDIITKCGGIDMQLLGLGHNGHIGFNEPGGAFEKETHCVNLTKSTIGCTKTGIHNGNQINNAGKENSCSCIRGRQGGYCKGSFYRPCNTRGACVSIATS
jgi:glucosamine-6-phosphate deaminase